MNFVPPHVSHHDCEVRELRADRSLAIISIQLAVEGLAKPDERVAGLLTLATVAEAYGDLSELAIEAGVANDPLYRALPPTGVPRLNHAAEYESWFHLQLQESKTSSIRKLA